MTWGRLAVSSQNILIYFSSDYNVRQTIQADRKDPCLKVLYVPPTTPLTLPLNIEFIF